MQLVRNGVGPGHRDAVGEILEGATQASIAVAFLKDGGAKLLASLLEARLGQGLRAEIFVGTDFYITEPKGLARLLALGDRFDGFEIFLAKRGSATFHPKAYVGRNDDRVRCLVGSANLTGGAMGGNEELSILVSVDPDDPLATQLHSVFADYRGSDRFQPLDVLLLEQYRSKHQEAERLRRKLEKELARDGAADFDLGLLDGYIRRYRDDKSELGKLLARRRDRDAGRKVQMAIRRLARAEKVTKSIRSAFQQSLSDLMTSRDGHLHLWHSGDIHRRGSEALEHPGRMIALFERGHAASRLSPDKGYAAMRELALDIPGVGVNMVTEILCTYAPGRYAVFNGNTAGALAAIGVSAPKGPTLKNLSAERYAQLCASIDGLRRRLGGADFTDADAFLNWLYFTLKASGKTG